MTTALATAKVAIVREPGPSPAPLAGLYSKSRSVRRAIRCLSLARTAALAVETDGACLPESRDAAADIHSIGSMILALFGVERAAETPPEVASMTPAWAKASSFQEWAITVLEHAAELLQGLADDDVRTRGVMLSVEWLASGMEGCTLLFDRGPYQQILARVLHAVR